MTWQEWLKLLLPIATPLAVAVLAYFDFFRRRRAEAQARQETREYDLVRRRYLDEGLDELIANVQNALSAYQRNWSLAMSLLKQFRDFGPSMEKSDRAVFRPLSLDEMSVRPVHRVCLLVRDDVIWNLVQLLSSFMFAAQFDFEHDLAGGLYMILEGKAQLKVPKKQALEMYRSRLIELQDRANRYFIFLSLLHNLSTVFEKDRFTFDSVSSFSSRAEVKDIVSKLRHLQENIQDSESAGVTEQQNSPDE